MKLSDLIRLSPDIRIVGTLERDITAVILDSRKVIPGSLFIALRGAHSDGHTYIDQAIEKGADTILVHEDYSGHFPDDITVIRSVNPRQTTALLATEFYHNPSDKMQTIGVTGTNGKTTVTYMVQSLLEQMGVPCGVIGTVGAHYGGGHRPTGATTPESPELQEFLSDMVKTGHSGCCDGNIESRACLASCRRDAV